MYQQKTEENNIYDLIIIGLGPAGLCAGIYGARYRLSVLIVGKEFGGASAVSHQIENYPGFISISGQELMKKMGAHVKSYGVKIVEDEVNRIIKKKDIFKVYTHQKVYQAKTIILALGTQRRKLNIPGEKEFLGKGVSYCATCDCRFFRNKKVAVVGGGDAAVTSALLLAEYASKVYIILRRNEFRAEPIWVEKLNKNPKIEKIYSRQVIKIFGKKVVEGVELNEPYHNSKNLLVDGVFVEVGFVPAISLAKDLGVKLDLNELIEVDKNCATNIPGCFAAGDITNATNLKQIITAASQGAIAATSAYRYLQKMKEK